MLYLTRYMLTGTRAYDYAKRSFVHEDELISVLDMGFILFCMSDDRTVYDTLFAICNGKLGKFHDMTKEIKPYRPYASYERDELITDNIEYRVVSSYLYSVDRKGKDGGAKSTSRISEIFKDIEEKLKIRYIQEENPRYDNKEIC